MYPRTRRQALRGAAALLAAFAGCSGSESWSGPSDEPRYPENVELDPETYSLRNPSGEPAVRRESESTTTETDADREHRRLASHGHWFVASPTDAASMVYADVEGAEEARRFVESTDFDRETIYVQQRSVGECYRLDLCYVGWGPDEIETGFGHLYRDADVACRVENEEAVATLIRIPAAIDPERIHDFGSSYNSGGCHYPPELRRRANGTATTGNPTTGAAGGTGENR